MHPYYFLSQFWLTKQWKDSYIAMKENLLKGLESCLERKKKKVCLLVFFFTKRFSVQKSNTLILKQFPLYLLTKIPGECIFCSPEPHWLPREARCSTCLWLWPESTGLCVPGEASSTSPMMLSTPRKFSEEDFKIVDVLTKSPKLPANRTCSAVWGWKAL